MKIAKIVISDDKDGLEMKFGDSIILEFSSPILSLAPGFDSCSVLIELENCCEICHFPDFTVEPITYFGFQMNLFSLENMDLSSFHWILLFIFLECSVRRLLLLIHISNISFYV